MPALKNLLHERFAQAYPGCKLRKMSLGEIYLEAGGTAKTIHSADVLGSRLHNRQDVQARIAELCKPKPETTHIDAKNLLAKTEYLWDSTKDDPDNKPTAAKCIELQGRLTGTFLDRTQIDATLRLQSLGTVEEIMEHVERELGPETAAALRVMIDNQPAPMVDVSPGSTWREQQREARRLRQLSDDDDGPNSITGV